MPGSTNYLLFTETENHVFLEFVWDMICFVGCPPSLDEPKATSISFSIIEFELSIFGVNKCSFWFVRFLTQPAHWPIYLSFRFSENFRI